MDNKSFTWRIWLSITLTTLGVLYYLVFLFYLSGGVPIEKIHYFMTDGWPDFCADNIPLVAPVFLFIGLGLWYYNTLKNKPKAIAEPEYQFEFNKVEKSSVIEPEAEYVFESKKRNTDTQNQAPASEQE